MSKKRLKKINRGDYYRVIISETSPYEVPIIFSNEGFYRKLSSGIELKTMKYIVGVDGDNSDWAKIPYKYKIRKSADSIRILSLLHPSSQLLMVEFYETYGRLICYYTSRNEVSLRAPVSVGASFYYKSDRAKKISKFRSDKILLENEESEIVHPSSYFAYKGYDRIYKYFDSEEMLNYEKRFSNLWLLDISKCFSSIYTHTISWATKTKDFTKRYKKANSFGASFDKLMQNSNHGETNGILIGPEVSRIFAEIILQKIDITVINNLKTKYELSFNDNYVFRRYVDDYFVYSNSESTVRRIREEISDELSKYNLYFNELKVEKYKRPYFTVKSKVIQDVKTEIKIFYNKFILETKDSSNINVSSPLEIHHLDELKRNFIHRIKSVCAEMKDSFPIACGYIISSLRNRALEIMDGISRQADPETKHGDYKNSLLLILEASFYFYALEPSVNSSYKLCQILIMVNRFFKGHFPQHAELIAERTVELSREFFHNYKFEDNDYIAFVPLEKLNILLAIRELGDEYLLPIQVIDSIFNFDSDEVSYFDLMSFLYYVKNNEDYSLLKDKALKIIDKKLENLEKINENAELAYLFLDTIACPFIDNGYRKSLILNMCKIHMSSASLALVDFEKELSDNEIDDWFIQWKELDLLIALEKKELELSYG
ncbi:hypothetical protein LPTSP4_36100 [Leptospira ryugenii]|uniref:Reverse transcriptase domain-containing protein n=1 Tax=Leptospira ryugenii TaxID=1917863 RepID=A0A2P2E5D6_9LEPT|nr:antiviral reverse transcriptase Drt3b [Leptospira ryugenii]GBF52072.1 hypothetical protein LPTSP4_36100 [Leptospira ryugenii]